MVDLLVLVHEDVEVDAAGALLDQLLPPEGVLDALERVQERQRLEVSLDLQTVSITISHLSSRTTA